MNSSELKTYAPEARTSFIAAVSAQANRLGIKPDGETPAEVQGDLLLIGGKAFPQAVAEPRDQLIERVQAQGFEQSMEAIAYTWFNRLAAIRYMELHGYLDHGYRVLSHPEGHDRPEILEHAGDLDLPGLDSEQVLELSLDGTQDEELYRLLLLAQCNALHEAMPFLFEPIGGADELLLPANLLHTDSLIRQLVESIDEEPWQDIEIIGWLYQFYISEKKDEVIGKVVKSEDIPAATQLFTPNWIVKYMVQNSLGAQWLATYPESPLKGQMEYYIEPAEQTDEVNAQLAAITPSQLNPEKLTLIDPASGSGHILVEAYELFKAIYLERGYRQRDVPQLILEKNLFGLDIDERAAQLTGFALMMKGRADDRRLFERGVKLNVMALVDSAAFDAEGLAKGVELADYDLRPGDLTELKRLFEHATTFGSLIQVPEGLAEKLPAVKQLSEATSQDLFVSEALRRLGPLVQQAELLAAQYDAVVANPPYMGGNGMNALLKQHAECYFPRTKSDLFAVSAERFFGFASRGGFVGLMTPFTWMFLKGYEDFREIVTARETLCSLIQPEYHAFFDSAYVPLCTFVVRKHHASGYQGVFIKLSDFYGADLQPAKTLEAIKDRDCGWLYLAKPDDFRKIPGKPIAYSASQRLIEAFDSMDSIGDHSTLFKGLSTGDNDSYIRLWSEVSVENTAFSAASRTEAQDLQRRWFPCNKGGPYRKWSGNVDSVIDWESDGTRLFSARPKSVIRGPQNYFKSCVSWSKITSGAFSARRFSCGFIPLDSSNSIVANELDSILLLANSKAFGHAISKVSETLDYNLGQIKGMPFAPGVGSLAGAQELVLGAKSDWNAYERSWDFQSLPLLTASSEPTPTLESSYTAWIAQNRHTIAEMKRLEEENNRLFIDAYGLADELTPDVPIEQITLTVNPAYRYGGKLTEEEQWTRFREDTMEELVSYAIGCMMGRYSLDAPGLIYAHSGNEGFDPSRYATFPADDDGIVPITDYPWFDDDATERLETFLSQAWPAEDLEGNLKFLAANLDQKKTETPRAAIRRYLATKFYKNHLQSYKKRPIYWLFSSGKQRAFQCLVYLHRYNEGTLSRVRTEYVIPLSSKISSRIDQLDDDVAAASSTSHQKKLSKERDTLIKHREELQTFDEKLRHYADQRIALDLDDGVKVNYGKFGDLLAEVKAIHGKALEL
jgi:type II restriction/modification system DNA methylase subunit YeeA